MTNLKQNKTEPNQTTKPQSMLSAKPSRNTLGPRVPRHHLDVAHKVSGAGRVAGVMAHIRAGGFGRLADENKLQNLRCTTIEVVSILRWPSWKEKYIAPTKTHKTNKNCSICFDKVTDLKAITRSDYKFKFSFLRMKSRLSNRITDLFVSYFQCPNA
jgi:hypothetical protein